MVFCIILLEKSNYKNYEDINVEMIFLMQIYFSANQWILRMLLNRENGDVVRE